MSRRDLVGALTALIRVIDNADNLPEVRRGSVMEHARKIAALAEKGQIQPVPWTPFEGRMHPPPTEAQIAMAMRMDPNMTEAEARGHFRDMTRTERLFVNSRYQVSVTDLAGGAVHLSIKRVDQQPIHDWRDLQRIKDELIGTECEAVELYPAISRVVDTANQYHLWGSSDPTFRFPLGFMTRLATDDPGGPAAQRPREASDAAS